MLFKLMVMVMGMMTNDDDHNGHEDQENHHNDDVQGVAMKLINT